MFLGLLVLALARPRRRLGRQAGGQHADRVALPVLDTPALPLLLGRIPLTEPRRKIKRLARHRFHREGRRGDPQDHVSALADRCGHTGPVPIALVDHREIARPQREVGEACGVVLIGHHDLVHPAGGAVEGEVDAPVVARAAWMPESGGIDQADRTGAEPSGSHERAGHREQCAQPPEQPGVAGAQALAPGGLRNVGETDQHGPGAEAAGRQGPQDVGEHRPE